MAKTRVDLNKQRRKLKERTSGGLSDFERYTSKNPAVRKEINRIENYTEKEAGRVNRQIDRRQSYQQSAAVTSQSQSKELSLQAQKEQQALQLEAEKKKIQEEKARQQKEQYLRQVQLKQITEEQARKAGLKIKDGSFELRTAGDWERYRRASGTSLKEMNKILTAQEREAKRIFEQQMEARRNLGIVDFAAEEWKQQEVARKKAEKFSLLGGKIPSLEVPKLVKETIPKLKQETGKQPLFNYRETFPTASRYIEAAGAGFLTVAVTKRLPPTLTTSTSFKAGERAVMGAYAGQKTKEFVKATGSAGKLTVLGQTAGELVAFGVGGITASGQFGPTALRNLKEVKTQRQLKEIDARIARAQKSKIYRVGEVVPTRTKTPPRFAVEAKYAKENVIDYTKAAARATRDLTIGRKTRDQLYKKELSRIKKRADKVRAKKTYEIFDVPTQSKKIPPPKQLPVRQDITLPQVTGRRTFTRRSSEFYAIKQRLESKARLAEAKKRELTGIETDLRYDEKRRLTLFVREKVTPQAREAQARLDLLKKQAKLFDAQAEREPFIFEVRKTKKKKKKPIEEKKRTNLVFDTFKQEPAQQQKQAQRQQQVELVQVEKPKQEQVVVLDLDKLYQKAKQKVEAKQKLRQKLKMEAPQLERLKQNQKINLAELQQKTKQVQLQAQKQKQRQKSKQAQKQKQRQKQDQRVRQKPLLAQLSAQTQTQRQAQTQTLKLDQTQVQRQDVAQKQDLAQAQDLGQFSGTGITPTIKLKQPLTPRTTTFKELIETGKTTTPKTPIQRVRRQPEDQQGRKDFYDVQVRTKGTFKTIARATSLKQAVILGRRRVESTAAASFRIRGADTVKQSKIGSILGSKKFRESKKEAGVFIQRRSFRISSAGEKGEITARGIFATKSKRKRGGIFK